jgi:hypothetical protein
VIALAILRVVGDSAHLIDRQLGRESGTRRYSVPSLMALLKSLGLLGPRRLTDLPLGDRQPGPLHRTGADGDYLADFDPFIDQPLQLVGDEAVVAVGDYQQFITDRLQLVLKDQ